MCWPIRLLIAVWSISDAMCGPTMGPFDIVITGVGHCPKEIAGNGKMLYESKLQKVSRTKTLLYAYGAFSTPFDDELTVLTNLAKQTSQGWKDNFFVMAIPKACSTFKTYLPEMAAVVAKANNLTRFTCPVPPGNYTGTVNLKMNVKAVPAFPYGNYRTRIYVKRGQATELCIEAYASAVPKKT